MTFVPIRFIRVYLWLIGSTAQDDARDCDVADDQVALVQPQIYTDRTDQNTGRMALFLSVLSVSICG